MRLLLECARAAADDAAIRAAAGAVRDWDRTIRTADAHAVAPLLAWKLAHACPEAVSGTHAATLCAHLHLCTVRSLNHTAELLKVLDSLAAGRIPAVPFKGPTIAWTLYESPGLREMGDLDILVRYGDFERALAVLAALGFTPPLWAANRCMLRWRREVALRSSDPEVHVDLHWRLFPAHFDHAIDLDWLLSRLAPVAIAGRQVSTFDPSDLLLLLCLHGTTHAWAKLGCLADIARLIDRGQIDWDSVLRYCLGRRVSRALFLGVTLVNSLLDARVPAEVLAQARRDREASRLAALCGARLLSVPPASIETDAFRLQMRVLQRLRDKARFLAGHFEPTPADIAGLRIPAALFPIYYAARPVRLAVKHGLSAARALAGVNSRRAAWPRA